jgi:FG-GAP-like repeat
MGLCYFNGMTIAPRLHSQLRTRSPWSPLLLLSLFTLAACGGSGGGGGGIVVTIVSARTTVPVGSSLVLGVSVTGCADCTVNWSLAGGDPGTLSNPGPSIATTYTSPFAVPMPNTITVTATSNQDSSKKDTEVITILGAFSAAQEFGLGGGGNPQAIVMGQFDSTNNATPDVAVADQDTGDVSVLLGNGAGGLGAPTAFSTSGSNPAALATGSFNTMSDTLTDIAAVNSVSDTAAILLGDGSGSFSAPLSPTVPTDLTPRSVAVGDFDGINGDDLGVANFSGDGTDGTVTILLSNGDGIFTPGQTITLTGSTPFAIATGFIDGDTNLDLVVADLISDLVWVILGNGNGTFQTTGISPIAVSLPPGSGPAAVVIGDVNGDTFADLAVVNVGIVDDSCSVSQPANADKVTILLGDGLGTFGAPSTYPVGSNPRAIALGDFNKDGSVDVVTANYCSHNVSVLFGVGDGTFQPAIGYDVDPSDTPGSQLPTGVAVGDLDNNGFDDIAVSNASTDSVSVLLNNN